MRFLFVILPLIAVLVSPAMAGGKRDNDINIVFHMETGAGENPKMVFEQLVAGQKRFFRRVPEISTRDVASFKPFPSQTGEGYGVLLKLKKGSETRLGAITASNLSRWMVARVNGRVVDGVQIDKQITDGELVIWKGLSASEVKMMDMEFPRIGEKKPRGKD